MTIAVVVKSWPRLSETFVAREILALESRGLDLALWSLRRPTDGKRHALHDEVRAPVAYLPEYLHEEPARVWRGWRTARRLPGYASARAAFLTDLRRDLTRNRVRRFGQACVLAAELPAATRALYAHFIHTPGSVARYAGLMRGLAVGLSAHARDIWTIPPHERRTKIEAARFVTVCTEDGAAALREAAPDLASRVRLNRHGLDLARWPAPESPRPARDGSDAADPVAILSVGRAVEKKGYGDLLDALARLPAGLAWRFVHIGGGEGRPALVARAAALGLSARCDFQGSRAESEVRAAMRAADVFALTPKIAADGDRDGLPNVLVEAQSQALAVVATGTGGVTELIRDGETGLIAPAGDVARIAEALARLIAEPELRARLGAAGRARVAAEFRSDPSNDRIAALLRGLLDG